MDEVVNSNDVRMRQFQTPLRFMFKLIQQRTILDHQVGKEFQRDLALQFFVARQPHNPHSASAEHLDQLVAAKHQLSAGGMRRRFQKAAWAVSLGSIGWDFRPALLANSDYRGHSGGSLARSALLKGKILLEVMR